MKKLITIFLLIALIFSLCACYGSKPDDIDQEFYEFGKKALDIADHYIDGNISADEADERLHNLYRSGEYSLPEIEIGGLKNIHNSSVKSTTLILAVEAGDLAYGTGSESKFLELRNSLAKVLNERER